MWLTLSIANVWACGVATDRHAVSAMLAATFFAVACWGMSNVRVMAFFDGAGETP